MSGSNLYAYVGSNPISRTDPTGLCDDLKKCMDAYKKYYYGGLLDNGVVNGFAAQSYIPSSGHTADAWGSTAESLAVKGGIAAGGAVTGLGLIGSGLAFPSVYSDVMMAAGANILRGTAVAVETVPWVGGVLLAGSTGLKAGADAMAFINCFGGG